MVSFSFLEIILFELINSLITLLELINTELLIKNSILMNIKRIIDALKSGRVNITRHAYQEAKNDSLALDDIIYATHNGEIIEDYPDNKPFPCCLMYGKTSANEPVHCVWAYDSITRIAVLITVYRPDPEMWIEGKVRKKL